MVGYMALVQIFFSGCRLRIEVDFGDPILPLSLGACPLKLTLPDFSMVTTGCSAGPDDIWILGGIRHYFVVHAIEWNFD